MSKGVPEEIELRIRIVTFALTVFAVNYPGLGRMYFQTTLQQPRFQRSLDGLRFLLSPAMHQSVIGIPTPGSVRQSFGHPDIKCIMHEQVSHYRTDYPALPAYPEYVPLEFRLHVAAVLSTIVRWYSIAHSHCACFLSARRNSAWSMFVVPRPSVNTWHFRAPSAFGLAAYSLPRPSCGWETPH